MKARALNLTNREFKALKEEINRQTAGNVRKLTKNLTALVMWQIYTKFKPSKKKLLSFMEGFIPAMRELEEYYMTSSVDETEYVCQYLLKAELGIDIEDIDDIVDFKIRVDK